MKKKRRNVPVYTNEKVTVYTQLTVQVDNAGDEWLTPQQLDFLESVHAWARYEGSNQLRAYKRLVTPWQSPVPTLDGPRSSDVRDTFLSTPAFDGAAI